MTQDEIKAQEEAELAKKVAAATEEKKEEATEEVAA